MGRERRGRSLFPFAFNQIGKAPTFGFLAAMAVVQGLFAWGLLPETKNKPLEEIEQYWNESALSGSEQSR